MPLTYADFPNFNWGLMNQANTATADPTQGTYAKLPDGTYQYFAPGQNPKAYLGDSIPGGGQWAVPGTDQANHLERLIKTGTNQAAIKIGALVGGGAFLGSSLPSFGSGAATGATGYGTGFASASDAAYGSVAPAGIGAEGVGAGGVSGIGAGIGAEGVGGTAAAGAGMSGLGLNGWLNLGSSVAGLLGSHAASNAQTGAAQSAIDAQTAMYNQNRADQTPWRQAGGQAVNTLADYYNPNSTTDYSKIISGLPGYQFQLQQGQQAVERGLSAKGLLNSGAAGKALTQYGQGMAQNYGQQYVNGLQSLAGLGQTATQATGQAGMNQANQVQNALGYQGNAQASGYAGMTNAIQSGLSGLAGIAGSQNSAGTMPQFNPYTSNYNYGLP